MPLTGSGSASGTSTYSQVLPNTLKPNSKATWLSLLSFTPRIGVDNVPIRPGITMKFNSDLMLDLVNDNSSLAEYIILVHMDTDYSVPVRYVSYDFNQHLLVIEPTEDLIADGIYQVTLRKELKNSQGRSMPNDRHWTFQVAADAFGVPELVSPADSSATRLLPNLSWKGVDTLGSTTFNVEVDTDFRFTNPVWSTELTVTGTTINTIHNVDIGVNLDTELTYYWRVNAVSGAVVGAWSPTNSFWLGSLDQPVPSVQYRYNPSVSFSVSGKAFTENASSFSNWPTLSLSFTRNVDASVATGIIDLYGSDMAGLNQSSQSVLVSGTVTVNNNQVTFTPSVSIATNYQYNLYVPKEVVSEDGQTLLEDLNYLFLGPLYPAFCLESDVRSLVAPIDENHSSLEISTRIWRASVEINRILMQADSSVDIYSSTMADVIAYTPSGAVTYGMRRATEYATALSLMQEYYTYKLSSAGSSTTLGPFQHEENVAILDSLAKRIKELRTELDEAIQKLLTGAANPSTVVKSQYWLPEYILNDLSVDPRPRFWSSKGSTRNAIRRTVIF